ncbi:MAG: peptidoglycan bridge formation glycyltransferase FemA/FemB family protein [Candidatus Promineifilaceae bacterium]
MLDKWLTLAENPVTQEDKEWDAFVASHPHGSILQTHNWARLKNRFGWTSQRVWLRKEGKLVAGAQILFKSAAMGLTRIGYIPHGPLVNWDDTEQVNVLLNQIDWTAYKMRAGLIKFEPLLWQDEAPAGWQALLNQPQMATNTDTIQPPNTMLVDLRPSLDDILASMKQKTRYNIRLAERKEITVRQGTKDDLEAFYQLMAVTGHRDGFGVHAREYYRTAYELFAPQQATLLIAEYQGNPLSAAMIFANGRTAAYLYGASSSEERSRMPNYAVQWAAIQWAKTHGCHWYDLWGLPDAPVDELEAQFTQRSDGLWGVYRFKRGFGGSIRRTVGAADRVYNKRVYRLYQWWRQRRSGS